MPRLGLRLGLSGFLGRSGGSFAAPTLIDLADASDTGASITDNVTSNTTPDITVTWGQPPLQNDAIDVRSNGSIISSHTVTSGEAGSSNISLNITLSAGSNSLTVRHSRGAQVSNWSNALVVVVDTTAPTLSSPSGAQLGGSTASLSVSTNEANGTLYYVVTTSATPPSAAQVKAGLNNAGTAALFGGSQSISSTGTKTATATGVTVGTRFAYFMHEDVAGNQSSVSSSSSWSEADITAPVLSSPTGTRTASTTATLTVTTDEGNGTLYGVLTLVSSPPSKAQIKAGQDDLGAAASYSFNQAVSGTGVQTKNATGLSGSATYFAYYMQEDAATNQSNVAASSSWTQADIVAPVLSSPTGTKTGATTATLGVTTDEGNGTLYGVLTLNSTPPSKAQIKAGQNAVGAAAAYSFNQSVSGTGAQTKSATGLTGSTTYFAYYMHEDAATNQSNVASASSFTTDAATFQGLGDVSATWKAWGSTARAYTAAYAAGGGAMFDVVDSGGANLATINSLTTGFVDLTTLNAWIVAHGTASVKKLYDQTGNGNHWTNATVSQMPTITQSALAGLPGMTCVSANATNLACASFTQAQPFSIAAVYKRTGSTSTQLGILSENSTTLGLYTANAANNAQFSAGTPVNFAGVNDNSFHAVQAVFNNASSVLAADGADTGTVTTGTNAFSSTTLRIARGSTSLDGIIMEVGIRAGAWNSTEYGNINSNAHSAVSGYNF